MFWVHIDALRVSAAVTRLTVDRRLQVMTGGRYGLRMFHTMPGSNTKRLCLKSWGRTELFVNFEVFFEKS